MTVVALGQTVAVALEAAAQAEGFDAEVIDLRTLMPWDKEIVERSVSKTGRLVTIEENQLTGGWGAEIASHVASRCQTSLRAPVARVTAPDVHVPYGSELELRFLPSAEYAATQIAALVSTGKAPEHWWEKER